MRKMIMWLCVAVLLQTSCAFAFGPLFDEAVNYATGDSPQSVFCGNLDGDNDADLAVANRLSGDVSILLNNGDGTFKEAVNYAAGDSPLSVFCSDLDADNDLDLAVANGGSVDVSILLNNGDGTFQAAVNYAAGDGPQSVFCSDLDGDNDPDLAVANHSSDSVSILLNNGDGTFQAAIDYAAGDGPQAGFCSDLDGDGDADLAVTNRLSNNVSILIGNGDGTFQPAVNYGVGRSPNSVFCSDLDGDNDLDLAVANRRSDNVSILLNNGDGTFQTKVNYPAGNAPRSAFCIDLNDDNDIDLALVNYLSDSVSIFLNNGDGTFQAAGGYAVGEGPWSLFCSDLDGDTDADLAVTNRLSNDVSILHNLTKMPVVNVNLDIKPGSCPNPLNTDGNDRGKAVLPVAILGTDEIDVYEIDPGSITLNGISPVRWSYEDVSTPVDKDGDSCACNEDGIDGYDDLTLKFDQRAIIASLDIAQIDQEFTAAAFAKSAHPVRSEFRHTVNHAGPPARDNYVLRIAGQLEDGSEFEGYDCIVLMIKREAAAAADNEGSRKAGLIGNRPNPFNPVTDVSFFLPGPTHVTIDIYNIQGQRIAKLVDDVMEAGEHVVTWDGSKAASGVYFYRLQAGNLVEAKKMLLLK